MAKEIQRSELNLLFLNCRNINISTLEAADKVLELINENYKLKENEKA